MTTIHPERPEDVATFRVVNETAFGQTEEADIVDALRTTFSDVLSLVALSDETVVGHIFFSPVQAEGGSRTILGMGLAPMAVLPVRQRQGIGSRLVEAGLRILCKQDCPFVIVLGHPGFYPRFGFVPASLCGPTCQWEGVPDAAFMVLVLDELGLGGVTGIARYRGEFGAAI